MTAAAEPVFEVAELTVGYRTASGDLVEVLRNVSASLRRGESLGIIGETGSGKSTFASVLLGHLRRGSEVRTGAVNVLGEDVLSLPDERLRPLRGSRLALVPQNAGQALTPSLVIGEHAIERAMLTPGTSREAAREEVLRVLAAVRLPDPEAIMRRYPHELSGGQQQRVAIGMALMGSPELIVMDEPTTGLDVTTQTQILELISEIRRTTNAAIVYVSHDLGVIARVSDRMIVLQHGEIVESGSTLELFTRPKEAYTQHLISVVPRLDRDGSAAPVEHGEPGERPVLTVSNLEITYATGRAAKRTPSTVAGIDLSVAAGEILALVGESGSGKSTIARAIAGLQPPVSGSIHFNGETLAADSRKRKGDIRRRIQLVFQNADLALNPRMRVEPIVGRPLTLFFRMRGHRRRERVLQLLRGMQLQDRHADRYPGQLSGGERQRVAIARALAAEPELVLCDEVVSALDVSVQASVLELILRVRDESEAAILFISHDLAVVQTIADRIAVLYLGRLCQVGSAKRVFAPPYHPYTETLLESVLDPDPRVRRELRTRTSEVGRTPPAQGCPFQNRCPRKVGPICHEVTPPRQETPGGGFIACHIPIGDLFRTQRALQGRQGEEVA